ncbi:MAG: LysE family transporter [Candidatus Bathyarchaeota archaeon]|nr:LysE family transporter [Candidatus Bathyarchaeum sp.]
MYNTNTQNQTAYRTFIFTTQFSSFMDIFNFAATVIILTTSGALAPGPLFFVTISHGIRSGTKSGIIFSVAHTIIEFTLVMLLALGLLSVANQPTIRLAVGAAGGAALIIFGAMQIRSSIHETHKTNTQQKTTKNLFLIGFALTGLNPYFIIWWLTIGANLIFISLEFAGLAGVIFMYLCHVWVDYAWLILVAGFAKKGAKILRHKGYRLMVALFGAVLIYFGLSFLVDALGF